MSMQLLASEDSADHLTCPPGITSLLMLTFTYIQALALHIHTQDRFNNHTVHSLYMVMGVMKMGNYCAWSGTRTHISGIPDQCATISSHRLPDNTIVSSPTCLAPCLRGQCRLLPVRAQVAYWTG